MHKNSTFAKRLRVPCDGTVMMREGLPFPVTDLFADKQALEVNRPMVLSK